jgi:hypothetical protein
MNAITRKEYSAFQQAYDHFNKALFDSALPSCLITMQRRARSYGYFSYDRFHHRQTSEESTDEIALNPNLFLHRTDQEIISVLVHEMTHQWQFVEGKPGRKGYHNQQRAAKMEAIGLMPSHTGEPGGKRTGQAMSHYILANGPFTQAWTTLAAKGFQLQWQSPEPTEPKKPDPSKVLYTCPNAECDLHAWAKTGVYLICGECQQRMV